MVEISPLGIAPVCQVGDQLELICNTSDMLQRWRFPAIPDSGRTIQSTGSSGVDPRALTINSIVIITFSRLSTQNELPLMSRMLINRVSEGLNGTEVECVNTVTSELVTTTIHIIGGRLASMVTLIVVKGPGCTNNVFMILPYSILTFVFLVNFQIRQLIN